MYVEDLLIKIRNKITIDIPKFPGITRNQAFKGALDGWSHDFVISVTKHVDEGRALSTKQAESVLKVISRLRLFIVQYGWATETDLDSMLQSPNYRIDLYKSTHVLKEVRHVGDNMLAIRCKTSKELSDAIKGLSSAHLTMWLHGGVDIHLQRYEKEQLPIVAKKVRWDWYHKLWIVPVYHFNLKAITDLLATHRIKPDEATAEYLRASRRSLDQPTNVAISEEDEVILMHVPDDPILVGWITEIAEGVAI